MLGLHFTPACVLLWVCSLHCTLSLHFTPGLQSAVCSPQSAFYTDRFFLGEGKRRNEFAEWHVAWLAEWHNYAEFNIRSWMIQRNKLNWKERPFWRQSICKRSRCFNVAGLTSVTYQPFRQSQKDSSSIEEKMFSKVTLPSTLIFSTKDACTINSTVSCYLYLYSKPCEKCFFMRLWVTWSWHNW